MTRETRLREMVDSSFEEAADQGRDLPLVVTRDQDGHPRVQTPWAPPHRVDEARVRAEAESLARDRRRAVRGA